MELYELARDAIASLTEGNFRAADSIAREIARLGGTMDPVYKDKVLERIQKLEQDALKYDGRGDTAQASAIVAEVERWRRSLGETTTGTVDNTAIETLDPDKYLGTIGLAADAPSSSQWPHHTSWPAADKGAHLRAVSNTTMGTTAIAIGQQWMCRADKTAEKTPSAWEMVQEETSDLYLGTFGLAEDAPSGTTFSHYTKLPPAKKGNWLLIASTALIYGYSFTRDSEILCQRDTLGDKLEDWIIKREPPLKIAEITRYGNFTEPRIIPHDDFIFINFLPRNTFGISSADLKQYGDKTTTTNISGILKRCRFFDLSVRLYFEPNMTGSRGIFATLYYYEPSKDPTSPTGKYIGYYNIEESWQPALVDKNGSIRMKIESFYHSPKFTDAGEPVVTMLGISAGQTSGVSLALTFAVLQIRGWIL